MIWPVLALWAALYLAAVRRVPGWPRRRTAAWLLGLAALGAASLTGAATMRQHMVGHLVLVNLAAPLVVCGGAFALALRAAPAVRPPLRRALRSRWLALALHPAVAVGALVLVVAGTHWPALYDAALDHPLLHALQHAAYLATALVFWAAVIGARPLPRRRSPLVRILVLLLAMPPMALVGVGLMAGSAPAYAHYASGDQHGAGRLMWLGGTLPMGAAVLVLAVGAAGEEERRQRRREAWADARAASAREAAL